MDYNKALEYCRTGRGKISRRVANDTHLRLQACGRIDLIYQGHPIVKWWPNGAWEVNTFGWWSKTARERLASFGPRFFGITTSGQWQYETYKKRFGRWSGLKPMPLVVKYGKQPKPVNQELIGL